MEISFNQDLPSELQAWVEGHLGELEDVRFCGHPHAESKVWALTGEKRAFLKMLRQKGKFAQELYAYRAWLPYLKPSVPQLIAADEAKHALLMTACPGVPLGQANIGERQQRAAYVQAGAFLRNLHALPVSEAIKESNTVSAALAYEERARNWLVRGTGIVERTICNWVWRQVGEATLTLGSLEIRIVPCHLDYTARNWLITTTAEGTHLSVIDFEHSRLDYWLSDVEKLNLDGWAEGHQAAFWQGYGRAPTTDELALADKLAAFSAFRVIVWAREHHDEPFEQKGWQRLRGLRQKLG